MPEVDRVLKISKSWKQKAMRPRRLSSSTISCPCARRPAIFCRGLRIAPGLRASTAGCDHRCTFCIIPYGRGNSRSVPIGEIVAQVRQLVENGYAEAVLSGVDISSYGGDLLANPSLGQMIRRLLAQVPELQRLRISSIDCIEIDDDLKRFIADEERLMPHLHLSLQSGDDMILKRMKRRHSRREAVDLCKNYGRCARTSSSGPTSSPAFRRKPSRCPKTVWP